MYKILKSLEGYYNCCDYRRPGGSFPLSLPNGIVEQMRRHIDEFLLYYSYLTEQSRIMNRANWNKVSKHHTLWHIGDEAHLNPPRYGWTYNNKDFVGGMSRIG